MKLNSVFRQILLKSIDILLFLDPQNSNAMEVKKSKKADLERTRSMYLQIGLVVSCRSIRHMERAHT